jgi:hypothetical protein
VAGTARNQSLCGVFTVGAAFGGAAGLLQTSDGKVHIGKADASGTIIASGTVVVFSGFYEAA